MKWVPKVAIKGLCGQVSLRTINEERWYLDSRCARHIIRVISMSSHIKEKGAGFVTYGDNGKSKIIEKVIEVVSEPKFKMFTCSWT